MIKGPEPIKASAETKGPDALVQASPQRKLPNRDARVWVRCSQSPKPRARQRCPRCGPSDSVEKALSSCKPGGSPPIELDRREIWALTGGKKSYRHRNIGKQQQEREDAPTYWYVGASPPETGRLRSTEPSQRPERPGP